MKVLLVALLVSSVSMSVSMNVSIADEHQHHQDSKKEAKKMDHKHHKEMKTVAALPGASIFQLNSKWKNQKNETVSLTDLKGKPRLMAMLYTRCETACLLIVADVKKIFDEINSKEIDVTLFSIDSVKETSESLAAFAAKRNLPSDWTLLTSDADAVVELAAAVGFQFKRLDDGEYIHSNVIFFLNGQGEIVAKKEGLSTPREEFKKEINKFLKESSKAKKTQK